MITVLTLPGYASHVRPGFYGAIHMAGKTGRDPSPQRLACCNCHVELGEPTGALPMHVDGEAWCPQCFVWKRAPMEPARYRGGMSAVKCAGKCGLVSVAFGQLNCGQCGSRIVVELPAKVSA